MGSRPPKIRFIQEAINEKFNSLVSQEGKEFN